MMRRDRVLAPALGNACRCRCSNVRPTSHAGGLAQAVRLRPAASRVRSLANAAEPVGPDVDYQPGRADAHGLNALLHPNVRTEGGER